MCAWRRASAGDIPPRIFSSASMFRWASSSLSNSASSRRNENKPAIRDAILRREANMALPPMSKLHYAADYSGNALPIFRFDRELLPAGSRERIESGLAVIFAGAPFRGDPAALEQSDERGVNRSLIETQGVFADLLDSPRNAVAVKRAHSLESLENHQIQGALQNI